MKKNIKVVSIEPFYCKEWLLFKHYAKRIPAIEYSFGLYINDVLSGVCTFGPPPRVMNNSECVFSSIRVKCLELNRLIVNDGLEKNCLSFFVSKCLNILPKPMCVVSYADHTFGHTGYIYQATNWIYTGLNQIHERQVFYKGKEIHPRTAVSMGHKSMQDWAKNDKDVVLGDYTKKHRYFYFLGSKRYVKNMKRQLLYPIKQYPKGDNNKYDSSFNCTVQGVLF